MAAHEQKPDTETGSASNSGTGSAPSAETGSASSAGTNSVSSTGNSVNSSAGQAANVPSASDDQPTRVHTKSTAQRAVELRAPVVNLLAGIVRWVGVLFAVVLVLHVILVIGEANPQNGITQFVASFADTVSIGFKDLFTPDDVKLQILLNYGIAAIFWLVVTAIVGRLLRRLA